MPPKKVTSAPKKVAPAVPHTSYRDMIKDAIISLKERNGSSRQAIKKYVQSNNKINVTSQSVFDSQFNKAIKAGVEKNEFTQPKGPSGPLKLAKKEAPVKAAPKPTVKPAPKAPAKPTKTTGPKKADSKKADSKKADPKKADPKKTGPKKTDSKKTDPKKTVTKTTKTTAPKKSAGKKAAATKPKANSGKARKTSTAAPAVVEQPKILGKTKSGRITKTTAPQPTTTRAAPKKRTTKK